MVAQRKSLRNTALKHDGRETCLLTDTSAMSCPSWSLPAAFSCPGMVARDDSHICAGCYAQFGRYLDDEVSRAQWIRFDWIRHCLRTKAGTDKAVSVLIQAIRRTGCRYFRIHDSGDFFSPAYVRVWARVCSELPGVKFWTPTRSYHFPTRPKALAEIDYVLRTELAWLPNVVIRPSALRWNEPAPRLLGYAAGSTAVTSVTEGHILGARFGVRLCPKSVAGKGASCESVGCRICWEDPDAEAAYLVHGVAGRHLLTRISPKIKAIRSRQRKEFSLPVLQ